VEPVLSYRRRWEYPNTRGTLAVHVRQLDYWAADSETRLRTLRAARKDRRSRLGRLASSRARDKRYAGERRIASGHHKGRRVEDVSDFLRPSDALQMR
jgi:hypothetical protein